MAPETEIKTAPTKKVPAKRTLRKAAKKSAPKEKIVLVKREPAHDSAFNHIARSVSIASVIMTALVLIIAPSAVWILGPVIGAMAIFGISMGYFASK